MLENFEDLLLYLRPQVGSVGEQNICYLFNSLIHMSSKKMNSRCRKPQVSINILREADNITFLLKVKKKKSFDRLLHSCVPAPPMCEWMRGSHCKGILIPTVCENRAVTPSSLKWCHFQIFLYHTVKIKNTFCPHLNYFWFFF